MKCKEDYGFWWMGGNPGKIEPSNVEQSNIEQVKNRTLWWLKSLIILFLALLILTYYHWPILYPNSKFEYFKEHQEFLIYADYPIDGDVLTIFDEVSYRLSKVLDYEQGIYKVFLCGDTKTYGYFADKVDKPITSQGFNLQPLNYVFVNKSFIDEIRKDKDYKYNLLEGNIGHIIAHEIVHQLIADKLGYFKMRKTNSWKLEGFCEFAASQRLKNRDSTYQFCEFANHYFNGKYNGVVPGRKFYITSLLAVEFLYQEKEMSFEDILNATQKLEDILPEIRLYCNAPLDPSTFDTTDAPAAPSH